MPQVVIVHAGDQDARVILREMDLYYAYPTVYLEESRIGCYPEDHIGPPDRSPWDVIGKRIVGNGRIGVEFTASNFSFADHQALVRVLGDQNLVDGSRVVTCARTRKSPAELGYMRQAAKIVDRALTNGIETIAKGVRQCDVAARITHDLIAGTPDCGGGPVRPVTMPTGPGVAQAPHLKWTDAPYRKGDQTDFEVGAFVHRCCCALSRTAFAGDPPLRLLEVHDAVMDGFHGALEVIRPGAICGDVHRGFSAAFNPTVRARNRVSTIRSGFDWPDLCSSPQDDDEMVLETDYTLHLNHWHLGARGRLTSFRNHPGR